MRKFTQTMLIAGIAVFGLPVAATAAPASAAPVAAADVITTCGAGYVGYLRRFGKDAICLKPGTRTWGGFEAFECGGKVTVYFKNGKHVGCPSNFPAHGGVVKTVASR